MNLQCYSITKYANYNRFERSVENFKVGIKFANKDRALESPVKWFYYALAAANSTCMYFRLSSTAAAVLHMRAWPSFWSTSLTAMQAFT